MLFTVLLISIIIPLAIVIICLCFAINKSSKLLEEKMLMEFEEK